MMDVAGATVFRGGFFHLSQDLPVMIAPKKLERAAEAIEAMVSDGLIVMSCVGAVRVVRNVPPEGLPAPRCSGDGKAAATRPRSTVRSSSGTIRPALSRWWTGGEDRSAGRRARADAA